MNTVTTITSVPLETEGGHVTSIDSARAGRSPLDLIVVRDGVEVPAPGRWVIPAQTLQVRTGPPWRRRRRDVEGELLVGEDLILRLDDVAGEFRFRGRLESADRTGRWRFRGDISNGRDDGRTVATTIDIEYHGVFRGGQAVAWLVVTGTGQRTRAWRASRTGAPVLSGGLNAVFDQDSDRGRRSCAVARSVAGASGRPRPPAGRVRSNDGRGTSWRRRRRRRGRRPDAGSHDRQRPGDRHDVRP